MRRSPTERGMRMQRLGRSGEHAAAAWYEARGYVVVDRNWRCRDGEIDLVLMASGNVVFCEVKTRSSDRFGTPFEAVTAAKQGRLRKLGVLWLRDHPKIHGKRLRFDVAAVVAGEVTVIENAF